MGKQNNKERSYENNPISGETKGGIGEEQELVEEETPVG